MNFLEYAPLALRTAKAFAPTERAGDLRHAALGLITETGEYTTLVKRWCVYDRPISDADRGHALEELGDVQWYVPLALRGLQRFAVLQSTTLASFYGAYKANSEHFPFAISTHETLALTMGWMTGRMADFAMAVESGKSFTSEELHTAIAHLCAIVTCCDAATKLLGADPDATREANIVKLRARFPEAYSDAAAEARADKGGADARNS